MAAENQNSKTLENNFEKIGGSMKGLQSSMGKQFKQVMKKFDDLRASNGRGLEVISEMKISSDSEKIKGAYKVFDKRFTRGISNRKVLISGYNQDEDCLYVETFEYVQKKLLISGSNQTEDCLCETTYSLNSIYQDINDEDDVDLDFKEEESLQTQLQIQQNVGSVVPAFGGHDFLAGIEDPISLVNQVCTESIQDKVTSVTQCEFSSPNLAANTREGAFVANKKEIDVACKEFNEMFNRDKSFWGVLIVVLSQYDDCLCVVNNPNEPMYNDSGGKTRTVHMKALSADDGICNGSHNHELLLGVELPQPTNIGEPISAPFGLPEINGKISELVPPEGLVESLQTKYVHKSQLRNAHNVPLFDGKIGCMVDDSDLIMITMDIIKLYGTNKIVYPLEPFDVGLKLQAAGTMLVTGVGINTEWGLLMASISEDTGEETPLQVRLNGVATFIGIVGLAVALSVLAILLARYFTGNSKNPDGSIQFERGKTSMGKTVDGVIKIITAAVTIVVVAVPEGLPLAVTLTLAYSMKKMMADKALVRRLSACETMGSATTICSDKTGTLTLNQMTVVEAYVGKKKINPPEDRSQLHAEVSTLLNEGIAQNTSGSVFSSKDGGGIEVSGSPTEKAILYWGVKSGMKFDLVRSECTLLHVSPFNSLKKRGGIALRRPTDSQVYIHWKGAAEIVLASCTRYLDTDGCLQSIVNEVGFFKDAIEDMAAKSLRCVAIAYKTYEMDKVPNDEEQLAQWVLPEDDLVLLAIVGIKDPCRPGVKDAVKLCTDAGVKVRMVTGDNLQTAKAIALECGILASDTDATEPNIIEGRTFREFSDKEREQVAKRILVMGRSSPTDKLLLVQTLRKLGEVVAVTGDGTNDAPALHEADIGLAMGIQGTEVAKESSDIIILDDNFASVVKVVRWGRSVYANIQKFIQFQLTVNVTALVINVVAAISSGDVPLNTVQLLWVNLIMDTLGALALATEPPTDHLMHRSPVGRREPLVTNIMWRNLIVQALYQVSILLVLNFCGESILNLKQDGTEQANMVKNSLIFNGFVFCQIFNEFNARKPDEFNVFAGVMKNHLFVGIVGTTFVLQIIIMEFLGKFTSTVRLDWKLWLLSLAMGLFSWPLAVLGKLIPVPKTPLAKVFIKPYQHCIASRNA